MAAGARPGWRGPVRGVWEGGQTNARATSLLEHRKLDRMRDQILHANLWTPSSYPLTRLVQPFPGAENGGPVYTLDGDARARACTGSRVRRYLFPCGHCSCVSIMSRVHVHYTLIRAWFAGSVQPGRSQMEQTCRTTARKKFSAGILLRA